MSASREKKIRQEQAANGYIDPKVERAAKQAKEDKKANIVYGTIAIVFVVVAAFLIVWKSGFIQTKVAAVTIDDEKFTAGDVSYYSYNVYMNYYNYCYNYYGNGAYISYFVDNETLTEDGKDQLINTYNWYKGALASGTDYETKGKENAEEVYATVKEKAEEAGYSYSKYLKALYGNTMTVAIFEKNTLMSCIASLYSTDIEDSYTYTTDQMEAYYKENYKDFAKVSYEQLLFSTKIADTTDADGKTVTATDEEKAAKVKELQPIAQEAYDKITSGTAISSLSETYSGTATYTETTSGTYSDIDVDNWLFDSERKDGDTNMIYVEGTGYYVLTFHKLYRDDYNTVSFRHILVNVDDSSLDSTSATYTDDKQALWDKGKATADEIYATWKETGTEEAFISLANEKSGDSAEDGLYTEVYKKQMDTNIDEWLFETNHKTGDTDVVESSYGYHVMYFVGFNDPYWMINVRKAMVSADYDAFYEKMTEGQEVVEKNGMKYVSEFL